MDHTRVHKGHSHLSYSLFVPYIFITQCDSTTLQNRTPFIPYAKEDVQDKLANNVVLNKVIILKKAEEDTKYAENYRTCTWQASKLSGEAWPPGTLSLRGEIVYTS